MAKKIKLSNSKSCAVVDDADFTHASGRRWHLAMGRPKTWVNGRVVPMHIFLKGQKGGLVMDHVNGDPLDNRRSNLRFCTVSQNNMNRQALPGSTSKHKGVYFRKDRRKWRAEIWAGGHRESLGCYDSEVSAAMAYNEAAKRLHGEFAVLNVIRNRYPEYFKEDA